MKNKSEILVQLNLSKKYLMTSFQKVQKISLDKKLSDDHLETLESFCSRFSRLSDIIIQKYFRVLAIEKDPAFRGSVIDLLNVAHKWGWINSPETWKRIRELRNLTAHEYSLDDIIVLYKELIHLTPVLLDVSHEL